MKALGHKTKKVIPKNKVVTLTSFIYMLLCPNTYTCKIWKLCNRNYLTLCSKVKVTMTWLAPNALICIFIHDKEICYLTLKSKVSLSDFLYTSLCHALILHIQLSRVEGWDPFNWFNTDTCLCLSQARTWISNICCGLFVLSEFSEYERWLFVLLILVELMTV